MFFLLLLRAPLNYLSSRTFFYFSSFLLFFVDEANLVDDGKSFPLMKRNKNSLPFSQLRKKELKAILMILLSRETKINLSYIGSIFIAPFDFISNSSHLCQKWTQVKILLFQLPEYFISLYFECRRCVG